MKEVAAAMVAASAVPLALNWTDAWCERGRGGVGGAVRTVFFGVFFFGVFF